MNPVTQPRPHCRSSRRTNARPSSRAGRPGRTRALLVLLVPLVCLLVLPGCRTPGGPKPGRTKLSSPLVELPATVIGNLLIVEAQWDRSGPWRFLIDTGSSVTLVSPEFADRYRTKEAARHAPAVRVRDAAGAETMLEPVTIRRIQLGDARFDRVQCLVYDPAELSAHLGVKIDGILGFPLFRETIMTMDYPQSRLIMTATADAPPLVPGSRIGFNAHARVPLIPVRLGDRTFFALIDSGSDGPLNLNPTGFDLMFATPPRAGSTLGTLTGDRRQEIARLALPLRIGDYVLPEPVVDLTDELSSLGGEVLRHFTLTFDQVRGTVTFYRDGNQPIASPPKRTSGISFSKTGAYWRVAGVVPDTPAAASGLHPGDLVVRINGEPVEQWNLQRFRALVDSADSIEYTLLNGRTETTLHIPTAVLVP